LNGRVMSQTAVWTVTDMSLMGESAPAASSLVEPAVAWGPSSHLGGTSTTAGFVFAEPGT